MSHAKATWPLAVAVPSTADSSERSSTEPTRIADHTAAAVDRLPEQHRHKRNIVAYLQALLGGVQEVEDAGWQLVTERDVDNAVGVQLDAIGKIVGQPRDGRTDDVYRRYVRARISANRSNGTIPDVLTVLELVVFDDDARLEIEPQYPAAFAARVRGVAVAADGVVAVVDLLRDATSAGINSLLEYSISDPANALTFDIGPSLDVGLWAGAT